MKLTIIAPALAAVLGLALAGAPVTAQAQTSTNAAPAAASAASAPATPAKTSKKKNNYTSYAGTITAIDASSVTVKTSSADLKLTLDATTQYKVAKKAAAATDFAVGDAVTGSYAKAADGTLTAHSVHKKK